MTSIHWNMIKILKCYINVFIKVEISSYLVTLKSYKLLLYKYFWKNIVEIGIYVEVYISKYTGIISVGGCMSNFLLLLAYPEYFISFNVYITFKQ